MPTLLAATSLCDTGSVTHALWGKQVAIAVALTGSAACGAAPAAVEPAPVVAAPAPVEISPRDTEISIDAQTTGSAVQVDVVGLGRQYRAGEEFERSDRWRVAVAADGVPLRRLLNGPARVERHPARGNGELWDVVVAFSVAFAVPEGASAIDVVVQEPGGRLASRRVGL